MSEDLKKELKEENQEAEIVEEGKTAEEETNTEEGANTESASNSEEALEESAELEESADAQDEIITDEADKNQEEAAATAEEDHDVAAEESAELASTSDDKPVPAIVTFDGEVDGETYTMDQLVAASEDYTDEEFHQLAGMYETTLNEIEEKEIVTGIVVSVDQKYVIVDIGFKSEGIIPVNEFSNKVLETLQPGDEVEVFLDRVEDREGQLILSRRKADILQAWDHLEQAHETGEVIEGYIQKRIKGGMVVDVFGIDAFLPGSQIDVRPVRDFDAYVGKTMEFQVVKLNMQAENVVVSHRALIESDLEEQREEILETIEPGLVLEGVVKNITDFGVFIDLGGVDGLLHITDLSWGRVDHPDEIVRLDQKINVAVIDYDEKSKRVSLGLKQLQPHPWDHIQEKYPENTRVQGRVVSIADYGAFVELEKGVEGLIHISEMSWTKHLKHPSQQVKRNDIVECVVLNINEDEKKISLGIKQLQQDPWENILERYPIGSQHKGTVRNITNFGAFVELEPGIDGLVHVSDLSWTEKIDHPRDAVQKDQELDVVILMIDFENRQITLGHKQTMENPWEKYADEYGPGSNVEGEISKITDKGLFVTLPLGAEAFLSSKRLEQQPENLADAYKRGDKVAAYVVHFDESSHSIELSQLDRDKKKAEKAEITASDVNVETGTPTLGEVSGLAEKLAEKDAAEKEKAKASKKAKSKPSKEDSSAESSSVGESENGNDEEEKPEDV